uniref:ribosomal protein L5 n=1 Tax=Ulva meridionalis TaxID=434723 RepID=UPI002114904B|nr:ribosomal protein L5 [Ulva meridionalis]UTA96504.1 ribosomal protein L5 [Ulva meridionalis]UTA96564.1 ribosomal protein L5 [Ulva meridionalis]UTA96621.1 ribosomal protein L5 [Ulva meridionalis]UTA96673.1 ribosomal protein L5 [Ulva meridionalis]UTA96726.1 ribosomal protein L5 [Ulva meridionalis]
MKYQKCVDQQILSWHQFSIQRYQLMDNYKHCKNINLEKPPLKGSQYVDVTKAHFNHPKSWNSITQIVLHTTTKKLLAQNQLYTAFYKCFCCCGQTPRLIKSGRPIAAFKVIKGAVVGAQSHLHKKAARLFCYKWCFLSAELTPLQLLMKDHQTYLQKKKEGRKVLNQVSIGINNIFIFPELDKLNYNLFQPIPGFDLTFHYK